MRKKVYLRKILYIFIFLGTIISLSACGIHQDTPNNTPPIEGPSTNEPDNPLPEGPSTNEPDTPLPENPSTNEPETPTTPGEDNPSTDNPSSNNPEKPEEDNPAIEEPEAPVVNEKLTLSFSGYYQSLNGVLDNDFKKKLHTLLESTHKKKLTYKEVWEGLKTVDEDPNNSNNIICIYTGLSIPKANRDYGSGNSNDIWNREHLWPKSLGFNSEGYPAHNDIHHLHASGKLINNNRGNKDFGIVTNYIGKDTYGNKWSNTTFEPMDDVKGDIARSILYMVVRYDGDNCSGCTLDLELITGNANTSEIIQNQKGMLGDLNTLLKWCYDDPVSEFEINRNENVYQIQGNRNPFIDHPEFVAYLYTSLVKEYTDTSAFEYLTQ